MVVGFTNSGLAERCVSANVGLDYVAVYRNEKVVGRSKIPYKYCFKNVCNALYLSCRT